MTGLVAEARIRLTDPETVLARLREHLAEHDVRFAREGEESLALFPFGTGRLRAADGLLLARAEAADLADLHDVRAALAAHVKEFAGEPAPEIVWTGDGSALGTPPNFRLLRVIASRSVTPLMRRITFAADDLARFATDANLHVRLLIPAEGVTQPEWPRLGRDGLVRWPDRGRLASRRYTIRRHDRLAGTIEIDFVLHAEGGPGSGFAARAKPGDVVGMLGPGGGGAPLDRDWYLLAGDETALPAIARILEALPATARGIAVIEVASPAERQDLARAADIELRWIYRDRCATTAFADMVRAISVPSDHGTAFAWIGCEFRLFQDINAYFREKINLGKASQLVVSYWRRGLSEVDAD